MEYLLSDDPVLPLARGLIALPAACDGLVLHPTLRRLMGLCRNEYLRYKDKAQKGELGLGDALWYPVQKQETGLAVGTNAGASHVAFLLCQNAPADPVQVSSFLAAYKALLPDVARLARHQNLKRMGVYLGACSDQSLSLWQAIGAVQHPTKIRVFGYL